MNEAHVVGADYGYFMPELIVGHAWIRSQGWLAVPDFTPAFCGGVPFLANPQSVFYSLPQLLVQAVSPTTAVYLTLLISAAVGGAAFWLVMTRCFGTSPTAGALAASLFLVNGFVFHRLLIGHLTYHTFGALPVLALVVLSCHPSIPAPIANRRWSLSTHIVASGLVFAYASFAGALNFAIPMALAVACLLLILQLRHGVKARPWLVLVAGGVWGALLSSVKLVPAAILVTAYPRRYLRYAMFHDYGVGLSTLLQGVFLPSSLDDFGPIRAGLHFGRHEFEMGLSIVPPVLMGLAAWRRRHDLGGLVSWSTLGLIFLSLVPIAVTIGPAWWTDVLMNTPLINNNTTLVRWWAIYLPPLILMSALSLDQVVAGARARDAVLVASLTVALVQFVTEPAAFYSLPSNQFHAASLLRLDAVVRKGGRLPVITRVGSLPQPLELGPVSIARDNEAFAEGVSAWPCYEPLFGYGGELLRRGRLAPGPVWTSPPDPFNLRNPALFFERPQPSGGWQFDRAHESDVLAFMRYGPISWHQPLWRRVVAPLSACALLLSLAWLGWDAAARLRRAPESG